MWASGQAWGKRYSTTTLVQVTMSMVRKSMQIMNPWMFYEMNNKIWFLMRIIHAKMRFKWSMRSRQLQHGRSVFPCWGTCIWWFVCSEMNWTARLTWMKGTKMWCSYILELDVHDCFVCILCLEDVWKDDVLDKHFDT